MEINHLLYYFSSRGSQLRAAFVSQVFCDLQGFLRPSFVASKFGLENWDPKILGLFAAFGFKVLGSAPFGIRIGFVDWQHVLKTVCPSDRLLLEGIHIRIYNI